MSKRGSPPKNGPRSVPTPTSSSSLAVKPSSLGSIKESGSSTKYEIEGSSEEIKALRKVDIAPKLLEGSNDYGLLQILPKSFQSWVDSKAVLPNINEVPLIHVYQSLAEVLNCKDYQVNICSYWYLDTVADILDKAQNNMSLSPKSQKLLIAWFGHVLTLLRDKKWSREEIFSNFHQTILSGGDTLSRVGWQVPRVKKSFKIVSQVPSTIFHNLSDMSNIVHLLYNVFANAFQFELIKAAVCEAPTITDVRMPHSIYHPRRYKSLDAMRRSKRGESKKKRSTDSGETDEDNDKYILPLKDAVNHEFFESLFHTLSPSSSSSSEKTPSHHKRKEKDSHKKSTKDKRKHSKK